VIGKVCRRGTDTRRLLGYLFTDGMPGERGLESAHVDARVIAGYQPVDTLQPGRRPGGGRADVSALAALLDAPVRAGGVGKDVKPTYHLAIRAARTDRTLTDAQWAEIAELYVDRLGLARRGDDSAVRWVAVRHADNHVHVVATLVRQDGRRVFPHHDFYRAREASLEVERRYGLTPTSAVDRTGTPETTRGEQRKHQRAVRAAADAGRPAPVGPDREVLRARVRAALAGAQDWEQFTGRLRLSGVQLRERYSSRNPGELTGYAVRLMPSGTGGTAGQEAVWFGGGKLAPDLSLPQLRARWEHDENAGHGLAGEEFGAARRGVRDGTGRGVAPSGVRRRSCRSSSGCGCGSAPTTLCAVPSPTSATRAATRRTRRRRPPPRPPPRCSLRSAGSWNANAVGRYTRPRRTTAGRRASSTDAPCPRPCAAGRPDPLPARC